MRFRVVLAAACFLMVIASAARADAPPGGNVNPNMAQQMLAQQIYSQCIKVPDPDLASGQQKYCACMAQNISTQITLADLADMAGKAGKNASQDGMEKIMMSNPNFNRIVQQCLSFGLGTAKN